MNSTDFYLFHPQPPSEDISLDDFNNEEMPKAVAVDHDHDHDHNGNPKRLQVPKACSNCRKMHSGCGLERPCRRCIQNGLEATCVDIPRKKRASRKRSKSEKASQQQQQQQQMVSLPKNISTDIVTKNNFFNTPYTTVSSNNDFTNLSINGLTVDGAMMFDDPSVWEDTYKELFGDSTSSLSPQQPFLASTAFPSDFSPLNDFQPQTLLITEMPSSLEDKPSSPSPNSIALGMSYNGLSASMATSMPNPVSPVQNMLSPLPTIQLPPSSPSVPSSVGGGIDLSFLIQQITELRDSNKHLENKLFSVSQELHDMKVVKPKPPQTLASVSPTGWVSFGPQPDLAISVWRAHVDACGDNTLIECNNKFVDMIGYPLEVLRNGFTCSKLVRRKDLCPENRENPSRDWPKRTQIVTAFGLRDVFITISPVNDQFGKPKYYITHILEVAS